MQAVEIRNETYHNLDLKRGRREVMDVIMTLKPCTVKEVADHLGKQVNQIVGRFSELRDEFVLIKEVGKRKNESTHWTLWDTYQLESDRKEAIYGRFRILTEERDNLINDIKDHPISKDSKRIIQKKLNQIDKQINQIKKL